MATSFFGKLKDKVNYKINEAVDDPKAKEFAEEERKRKEKELENRKNTGGPIKEAEKTKEEQEQQKVLDFLKNNGKEIETKIVPMIDEYTKQLQENGKSIDEITKEKGRIFGEVLKVAQKSLSIDEMVWSVEDLIDKALNPTTGIQPKKIVKNIWRNIKRIVQVAFIPFIGLVMASLISNEMIVYPPAIRLIFFIFTFILCIVSNMVLFVLVIFYLCKWGYHYYVNEMSDGPKRNIMPTLFAFLPLTTSEYTNRFKNFIVRPFQYGERWSKKDGEELKKRMELYETSLKESFPFIEVIKSREPYDERLKKIQFNFEKLHKYIAPFIPSTVSTTTSGTSSEPPLPPVIQPITPSAPATPASTPST